MGNETVCCPMCYRTILTDDSGKILRHSHTPMVADAICTGGGKTREEALASAVAEVKAGIRAWKAKQAKKKTK